MIEKGEYRTLNGYRAEVVDSNKTSGAIGWLLDKYGEKRPMAWNGLGSAICGPASWSLDLTPATVQVEGAELPRPCREPLKDLQGYCYIQPKKNSFIVGFSNWTDSPEDNFRLAMGFVWKKQENAQAWADFFNHCLQQAKEGNNDRYT